MIGVAQHDGGLAPRFSALDQSAGELCRTDAGQAAPDGRRVEERHDRIVNRRLNDGAEHTLVREGIQTLDFRRHRALLGPAADGHAGGGGRLSVLLTERGHADVALLLVLDARERFGRQQVQQHLLCRVLHVVPCEYVFHRPFACNI